MRRLPHYTLTFLSPLPGYTGCAALSLNGAGQIVGASYRRNKGGERERTATLWRKGTPVALAPGDDNSFALVATARGEILVASDYAESFLWRGGARTVIPMNVNSVNSDGLVVGDIERPEHDQYALVWRAGKKTPLEKPAFYGSTAFGVNDRGIVVGYAEGDWSGGAAARWEYTQGKWRRSLLGTLPQRDSGAAKSVNERGQIVGKAYHAAEHVRKGEINLRAFLWEMGRMRDFGALHLKAQSAAQHINDRGQIVGWSETEAVEPNTVGINGERATLWQGGVLYDLNRLIPTNAEWTLRIAYAINDRGDIVGVAENAHDKERAFLLTPTAALP